jgi:hypothetical protein
LAAAERATGVWTVPRNEFPDLPPEIGELELRAQRLMAGCVFHRDFHRGPSIAARNSQPGHFSRELLL